MTILNIPAQHRQPRVNHWNFSGHLAARSMFALSPNPCAGGWLKFPRKRSEKGGFEKNITDKAFFFREEQQEKKRKKKYADIARYVCSQKALASLTNRFLETRVATKTSSLAHSQGNKKLKERVQESYRKCRSEGCAGSSLPLSLSHSFTVNITCN